MTDLPECLQPRLAFIAIREFAAAAWAYEKRNTSFISDGQFDELCEWLLVNYKWVKPHDLNDYIDKSSLRAGTGMRAAEMVCGPTLDYAEWRIANPDGKPFVSAFAAAKPEKAKAPEKKSKPKRDIESLLG